MAGEQLDLDAIAKEAAALFACRHRPDPKALGTFLGSGGSVAALIAEVRQLREALAIYADERHWSVLDGEFAGNWLAVWEGTATESERAMHRFRDAEYGPRAARAALSLPRGPKDWYPRDP